MPEKHTRSGNRAATVPKALRYFANLMIVAGGSGSCGWCLELDVDG